MAKFTVENHVIVELDEEPREKAKPSKKQGNLGSQDPDTRDFYYKWFLKRYHEVMGYKYPGDRYKDCSSIYAFIHNTQYDVELLKEMVDFILNEKKGYWEGKPLSINLLCYGRTHYDIIDAVQKRKKMEHDDAPDLGHFLEELI